MTLFMSKEKKYFKELAAINQGKVAIVFETRKGKGSNQRESAFVVDTPRGFAIKMNELMMVSRSFKEKYSVDKDTYFKYCPIEENFTLEEDFIILKGEKKVSLRKVPFYDSYLWEE